MKTQNLSKVVTIVLLCAVMAMSGCAMLKKHVDAAANAPHGYADLVNNDIAQSLSALQDLEMQAFKQGFVPVGEYVPATDTTKEKCSGHRCFNAKLLVALEAGRSLNKTLMTWQVGTPMPKSVQTITSTVSMLMQTVIAALPDSPTKTQLLLYSGAAQDAVIAFFNNLAAQEVK